MGALVACLFGVLLGAPTLKLRGDYLAIVTLGFGEIVRIFLNNLSQPVNITNGPQGISRIDPFRFGAFSFSSSETMFGLVFTGPIKYYYLLLAAVAAGHRGQPAPAAFAHRPRLGGDPRGRDRGARDGHQHHAASSCSPSPWAPPSAASPAACSPRSRVSSARKASSWSNPSWCCPWWCWAAWAISGA